MTPGRGGAASSQAAQRRFQSESRVGRGGFTGQTVLAIPSLSLPYFGRTSSAQLLNYEERIFYLAHILKEPSNRLIVVTSRQVPESLVSYLLHLLPGVPYNHARRRLTFVPLSDDSRVPLTEKLLSRPALLARLRGMLASERRPSISCYTVTELEERLAEELQVPLYGPRSEHLRLATKSGSRQLFAALEMTHPAGASSLFHARELVESLVTLSSRQPNLDRAVLKHNYSLSGFGNAVVPLEMFRDALRDPDPYGDETVNRLTERLPEVVRLAHSEETWESYWERFRVVGGVMQEYIDGSPCSVQGRIELDGAVEVIATHDEITYGRDGQTYAGCRFPAQPRLAQALLEAGLRVGCQLQADGVVGRYEVDFLATPAQGDRLDELYALDINLRKGNTTLPMRTLQLLSSGRFYPEDGEFRDDTGRPLVYLSSDHFGGGLLHGMLPRDLMEIVSYNALHYSSSTHTGAVFHMLGGLSQLGQTGITVIERDYGAAARRYEGILNELQRERDGFQWMT